MLRFTIALNGLEVAVNPDHVSSVREYSTLTDKGSITQYQSGQAGVLNAKQVATIVMSNGHEYTVDDPNRTVARQIEEARKK